MKRQFYGKAVIDSSDSNEISPDYKIELEYYQIKDEETIKPYGIEIIKKNIKNTELNIEQKTINNICNEEQEMKKLLNILLNNKVTPIALEDIIQDLTT